MFNKRCFWLALAIVLCSVNQDTAQSADYELTSLGDVGEGDSNNATQVVDSNANNNSSSDNGQANPNGTDLPPDYGSDANNGNVGNNSNVGDSAAVGAGGGSGGGVINTVVQDDVERLLALDIAASAAAVHDDEQNEPEVTIETVTTPPPSFLEPILVDEDEEEVGGGEDDYEDEGYMVGGLPRPRFVMLGQQGVGKSSMANTLLGFDNLASLTSKKLRKELPFKIGHGLRSKTKKTTFSTGRWIGAGPNITVVDTPGFKDTEDAEFVDEMMNVLGDEVKEVDSFMIVYKYKDRFTRPFRRTLTMLTKMFGHIWTNVVLVVNFWSFKEVHDAERRSRGVTPATYAKQLKDVFRSKFDLDFDLPLVFLDTHYNRSNPEEKKAFDRESQKLWSVTLNRRPFLCLTRKDIQDKLAKEKQGLTTMKRKCKATKKRSKDLESQIKVKDKQIASQLFVMNNLRNGIDYLKEHCSKNAQGIIYGCQWSQWTDWSECSKSCGEGSTRRIREKLPGLAACDGPEEEITVCQAQPCPVENDDNSVVVIVGGETVASRENEHSRSVEILGPHGLCRNSGVPDLPEGRGKLNLAYDSAGGAILVCGGGMRFWGPNAECWQLVAGATNQWQEIPQMFPVHGAASTFFRGKLWVLGGSTGDDSYENTITDKVQAYNPRLQEWSVEEPLTSPRQKACAVTIEDTIVMTGGTMLGLGKIKPSWVQEVGSRTAEAFNGDIWTQLPAMKKAKVEHGCAVATIGGAKGVVVVGGATGNDVVEFLDWDAKKEWITISKLNRGRGMMPGVGFVGGTLSVIGGYSWPGGVALIEQWDEDLEEWITTPDTLKYPRYNHGTVTVPGEMFPQCTIPNR